MFRALSRTATATLGEGHVFAGGSVSLPRAKRTQSLPQTTRMKDPGITGPAHSIHFTYAEKRLHMLQAQAPVWSARRICLRINWWIASQLWTKI